jgi:hypothetical protein
MPNATGLRDVRMEDSDRWVLRVVVKFHPDLTTVVRLDNYEAQPRLYQKPSRRVGAVAARFWTPRKLNASRPERRSGAPTPRALSTPKYA